MEVSADRSEFIFIVSQFTSRNGVTTLKTGIFSHAALETSNLALSFLSQRTARYVGHRSWRSLILHNAESTYITDQLAAHRRFQILFHGMRPQHNTMNTYGIMAVYFAQLCTTLDVGVSKLSRNVIVYTSIHGVLCHNTGMLIRTHLSRSDVA